MYEVSSHVGLNLSFKWTARPSNRLFYLVLESYDGRALVPIPKKHEPVSDIDTAVADSLKVLDLKRPIREVDVCPSRCRSRLLTHLRHGGLKL